MSTNLLILPGDTVNVTVADPQRINVTVNASPQLDFIVVAGLGGSSGSLISAVLTGGDDSKTTFVLPRTALYPLQISVFRNGLREVYGIGFTATPTSVTFSTPPLTSDQITVLYAV